MLTRAKAVEIISFLLIHQPESPADFYAACQTIDPNQLLLSTTPHEMLALLNFGDWLKLFVVAAAAAESKTQTPNIPPT